MSDSLLEPNHLDLKGCSIMVTRAAHQAGELALMFEREGASVLAVPTIKIAPPIDLRSVDRAISDLESYDWVIFASVNAVDSLLERINSQGHRAAQKLGRAKLAAIGAATQRRLKDCGLPVDFVPSQFVAESLVEEFPEREKLADLKILLPRTGAGGTVIQNFFKERGALVDAIETYRTLAPDEMHETQAELKDAIEQARVDVITIASSESARNLARLLYLAFSKEPNRSLNSLSADACAATVAGLIAKIGIVAIGPKTSATAKEWLGKCDRQATQYDLNGLVEATRDFFAARSGQRQAL